MKMFSKSDVGKKRTDNQDSFIAVEFDNGAVFAVVCDGMGGASSGNVASALAVKTISNYVLNSYSPKMNGSAIENMLRAAVDSANTEVYESAGRDHKLFGMGTTAVVCIVVDNLAHIVHVGDSRAYLVTQDGLERLTNDHSVVQSMIDKGEISEEEAKSHPKKNIITRALGAEETVFCDYNIAIKPEMNALLICTDGLTNYVSENDIFEVIKTVPQEDAVDRLIELANNGGGGDNITAVLIY